jgi:hypothetical protein
MIRLSLAMLVAAVFCISFKECDWKSFFILSIANFFVPEACAVVIIIILISSVYTNKS